MSDVQRFETTVDLESDEPGGLALTARLDAVLADGRRVAVQAGATVDGLHAACDDGDDTDWDDVARALRAAGIADADPLFLRALPHDVVLSDAVRARLTSAA